MAAKSQFAGLHLWAAVTLTGVGVALFAYVAVQQIWRQSANDPQNQMAEDTVASLNAGESVRSFDRTRRVNEKTSLAPFMTVVDKNLMIQASSGEIGTRVPLPPRGSFASASTHGKNSVTWEHDGVRDAVVIVPYDGGYVLAARSLREVEENIENLTHLFMLTILGILLVPVILLGLTRGKAYFDI